MDAHATAVHYGTTRRRGKQDEEGADSGREDLVWG